MVLQPPHAHTLNTHTKHTTPSVTHANGFIRASQEEPYGDISIAAGPRL